MRPNELNNERVVLHKALSLRLKGRCKKTDPDAPCLGCKYGRSPLSTTADSVLPDVSALRTLALMFRAGWG